MKSCILLLAAMTVGAETPRPEASRVSLDVKAIPLAEAVAKIAQQTNIPIDVERARKDKPVTLRLENVPFWEALEQLARVVDHRLAVSSHGRRIALVNEPFRPRPTAISGIYRFGMRGISNHLDFDSGAARTDAVVDIAWEPKFKAYFVELDPKSVFARDDRGQKLDVVNEGSSRIPVTENGPELLVRLRQVPRVVRTLAEIGGEVKILGTSQSLRFDFDLSTRGEHGFTRADVTAALRTFSKNVRLWTFVVDLQYPKDMPEFESFQSFLVDNQAWLEGPGGKKYSVRKFELGFERQGKTPITYYVQENDKDGPVLANPAEWKLVVRVPGRIIEDKVRFQVRDIPLP